jgi:hypothetical protein
MQSCKINSNIKKEDNSNIKKGDNCNIKKGGNCNIKKGDNSNIKKGDKLHVFGNNSKTINNIRNLTWLKMISTGRSNYPQKQKLPLAAIFVGGMGRNEETL